MKAPKKVIIRKNKDIEVGKWYLTEGGWKCCVLFKLIPDDTFIKADSDFYRVSHDAPHLAQFGPQTHDSQGKRWGYFRGKISDRTPSAFDIVCEID